ncbi:hypothetical protein GCM10022281_14440 [Sphingomonas rosea]|uniref:Uncharacterized protein n=1 Tax=Sphingomonas rosea TaxID=335605 RepID=A0ABP7U3B7_9SPHN
MARWEDEGPAQGAAHGNLFGKAEHEAAEAFYRHRDGGHDEAYARYRSNHLAELDRDYDEWRREREAQFHGDFEDWRSRRRQQASNQPGDKEAVSSDLAADELAGSDGGVTPPRARRQRR